MLLQAANVAEVTTEAYKTFMGIINVIFPVVIGIVLVLGMFYGITLAIKYAKAEEDEDKKKAKSSLINVIVGCLVAIIFVAVIQVVLKGNYIKSLFNDVPTSVNTSVAAA